MKKTVLICLVGIVAMCFTSCSSTKSLYSWYNYEDAAYQYNKKTTDELKVKLAEQYQLITETQAGVRGAVPPGMFAEYGYLLCMNQRTEEGINFLKKEIELYPESKIYIERIIQQLEK